MIRDSKLLWILAGAPALLLAASYGYLAWEHGTLLLFARVVHEGGRHTLLGTVFYFEHFLRELPIDLLMALAIAGWWRVGRDSEVANGPRGSAVVPLALALLLVALALGASSYAHGWAQTRLDLLQYRTRDDLVSYGSHWHSHWLHLLFMLPAAAILPAFRGLGGSGIRGAVVLLAAWVVLFLGFTVVFGLDARTFADARYLGHQAREIATHATVTLPLAWAVLLVRDSRSRAVPFLHGRGRAALAASAFTPGEPTPSGLTPSALTPSALTPSALTANALTANDLMRTALAPNAPTPVALVPIVLTTIAAAAIPVWIAWRLRGIDLLTVAAKQSSYPDLLASHFFEHTLDYLLVALLVMAIVAMVERWS